VNGTLVQGFDLDDVHRVGVLHVGGFTLPAVLRWRELRHACRPGPPDRRTWRATRSCRGGMCMGPIAYRAGLAFRCDSVCLLRLRLRVRAALRLTARSGCCMLGYAGTQSAGLRRRLRGHGDAQACRPLLRRATPIGALLAERAVRSGSSDVLRERVMADSAPPVPLASTASTVPSLRRAGDAMGDYAHRVEILPPASAATIRHWIRCAAVRRASFWPHPNRAHRRAWLAVTVYQSAGRTSRRA